MKMILMAAAGGAIGAAGRYLVGVGATRLLGIQFPWGTLTVNVLGSFLMGVLVTALALRYSVSNEVRAFLAIGILGGFTTFSSFSLDVIYLLEKKQAVHAAAYLSASVILSIFALVLGMQLVRQVFAT